MGWKPPPRPFPPPLPSIEVKPQGTGYHEFGTRRGNVPARPYLRDPWGFRANLREALSDLRAIFTGTYGARYEPPKRDAAPTDSGGPG